MVSFTLHKIQKKKPQTKEATIIHIHGGPNLQTTLAWKFDPYFYTSQGINFFSINYRGSAGFGRKFLESLNQNWGNFDTEDAVSAAQFLWQKELVSQHNFFIMGGSAGGFTALKAACETPSFWQGAISLYGISDFYALEQNTHRFEKNYNGLLLGKTKKNWDENSIINKVNDIKIPVLLFHGKQDKAVPHSQSEDLAKILEQEDKTHLFFSIENEGHGFKSMESKYLVFKETLNFIRHHSV